MESASHKHLLETIVKLSDFAEVRDEVLRLTKKGYLTLASDKIEEVLEKRLQEQLREDVLHDMKHGGASKSSDTTNNDWITIPDNELSELGNSDDDWVIFIPSRIHGQSSNDEDDDSNLHAIIPS